MEGGRGQAVCYTGRMAELLTETSIARIQTALKAVAVGLLIAAVPLFLITTNIRLVVNWPRLYSNGFDKYDIPNSTPEPIERGELLSAAEQIRDYFNSDDEFTVVRRTLNRWLAVDYLGFGRRRAEEHQQFIDIRVVVAGVRRSLFNSREILHMKDVKGLIEGVYTVQWLAGIYIAAFIAAGLALARRRFLPELARYAAMGGAATAGLVVLAGAASMVGFEDVFYTFHIVSFSNDLWLLDPRTDYLIAMFPEDFFFDATMWIAGATIAEALLLLVPAAVLRWRPGRLSADRSELAAEAQPAGR